MSKHIYTLFYIIALFVIIYAGVDIFYKIIKSNISQFRTEEGPIQQFTEDQRHWSLPLTYFKVISDRNLFGTTNVDKENVTREEIDSLKPTSLNIALLGTFTGNNQNAFAVIEETDIKKEALYGVGDEVKDAVIRKILREKVVLSVDGRDEVLTMAETHTSQNEKRPSSFTPIPSGSSITVELSELRNSLKNINRLVSEARIRPHFRENGETDGLSVTRIKKGSVFAKLGLRDGDIVQGIDDRPIRSPDDILGLYNKLKAGTSVSLQLERGGNPEKIEYNFK